MSIYRVIELECVHKVFVISMCLAGDTTLFGSRYQLFFAITTRRVQVTPKYTRFWFRRIEYLGFWRIMDPVFSFYGEKALGTSMAKLPLGLMTPVFLDGSLSLGPMNLGC